MTLDEQWEALKNVEPPVFPAIASGVDLRLLAADTADCVSVFLATGSLDAARVGTLRACGSELRGALPTLSGPAAEYVRRLAALAGAVLLRATGTGLPGT